MKNVNIESLKLDNAITGIKLTYTHDLFQKVFVASLSSFSTVKNGISSGTIIIGNTETITITTDDEKDQNSGNWDSNDIDALLLQIEQLIGEV